VEGAGEQASREPALLRKEGEESMYDPWIREAIAIINADYTRSSDTHMIAVTLPALSQIKLYMKDESTHITGSLKHRLARSLFLYALCNGKIRRDTTIIEASSGSTAVSEAYYANLLGLPFLAVMAEGTSPEKIRRVERYHGQCVFVKNSSEDRAVAKRLAAEKRGHFMDQFTFAERATDWRGNNNIAESIFAQLVDEPEPYRVPQWIICGAGTGGTSATLGRYIRYRCTGTQVCVVDPGNSVYYDYYTKYKKEENHPAGVSECLEYLGGSIYSDDANYTGKLVGSGVEGIGRPHVEPSFLPEVVDHMIKVPNAASYAAIRALEELVGKRYGGSTGTNFYGACKLMADMARQNKHGSLVMIGCDAGELYRDTYYSDQWLAEKNIDIAPYLEQLRIFCHQGDWMEVVAPRVSVDVERV
jgi:cysteine synthase A